MAIDPGLLQIRYGDVTIGESYLSARWEVYHAATATVIESSRIQVALVSPQRIAEAWNTFVEMTYSATRAVLSKHQGVAAIGGYSVWDADLILDSWLSDTEAHTLTHPISGTFASITYTGIVGLVNVILTKVLPPPVWFWSEKVTGGLRVKCVAVSGATSYNVYNGTALLGSVPNANWNTLTLADGLYNVRIAGVKTGIVGVCSFPVPVQVGTASLPLGMIVPASDAEMAAPVEKPKRSIVKRAIMGEL